MLDPDAGVWLLDLGIARLAVDDGPAAERVVQGTPPYLSPEPIDRGTRIDGRADLNSDLKGTERWSRWHDTRK